MSRAFSIIGAVAAALLGPVWAAGADETGVSYAIHHHYVGSRPLGMGDAFVAVANDYNAIFYNPAGLARREEGEMNLFLDAKASANFMKLSADIKQAQDTPGTDTDKQNAMLDVIQDQYGKAFGLRTTLFSGIYVGRKWGIAVIPSDLSVEATIHQSTGPALNTTVYNDTTVALSYGDDLYSSYGGRLSWGITGKAINRGYYSKAINFLELAADPNLVKTSDFREGFGVDADVGFLFTPYIPRYGFFSLLSLARPTFGLVVRNVAETKFTGNLKLLNKTPGEDMEPPEKMYRVIDVGTRWEYPAFWLFGGRGTMDIRDIMHPRFSLRKGLHVGFEFDWTVASWWKGAYRVGWNEGYYTAGASAMFALFNLDLVTYAQDVGTFSRPVENRTYAVRLNFNW